VLLLRSLLGLLRVLVDHAHGEGGVVAGGIGLVLALRAAGAAARWWW
jgi:hypothetical protein